MFGLKIVNKQDYINLKRGLEDSQAFLAEKYGIISSLEKEIVELKKKLSSVEKEEDAPKRRNSKTVLLTDVAEEALKVENKPRERRRRTPKLDKKEVITK